MTAALDALDAAVATISALDVDRCGPVTRLRALERLETARRRQIVALRLAMDKGKTPGNPPRRAGDGRSYGAIGRFMKHAAPHF